MKELLKRWAELEPMLCKYLSDGVALPVNGEWVFIYATLFDANMFIQYKVQQAIVARGWRFGIQHYSDDFQVWVAAPNGRYCWSNADSPAEALLSAYVKALEQA